MNCLLQISQNSSEDILFVEEPWTVEAHTQIITDEQGQTVVDIHGRKYTYFLEAFIINELLEELDGENMTFEKKCQRIIEYASNDA